MIDLGDDVRVVGEDRDVGDFDLGAGEKLDNDFSAQRYEFALHGHQVGLQVFILVEFLVANDERGDVLVSGREALYFLEGCERARKIDRGG